MHPGSLEVEIRKAAAQSCRWVGLPVVAALALNVVATLHGGDHWVWEKLETPTESNLHAIGMVDAGFGVAAGAGGTVLKWNGGAWTHFGGRISNSEHGESEFPGVPESGGWGEDTEFHAVVALSPESVWIGSAGAWSGDGSSPGARGVDYWNGQYWSGSAAEKNRGLKEAIFCLWPVQHGWVLAAGGAPGRIALFDGESWRTSADYQTGFYRCLQGVGDLDVWAAGMVDAQESGVVVSKRIIVSRDGGQTWQAAPFLNDSEWADRAWKAVACADSSKVWFLGDNKLIGHWDGSQFQVLNTQDEGLVGPEIILNAIFAPTSDQVWVVGTQGMALFFDGQHWTQPEVPFMENLNAIAGDGEGAIWVVGDNGTIYRGRKADSATP